MEERVTRFPDRAPDFETIRYERDGWGATIVIDRPSTLNSLNQRAFVEINEALRMAEWDDSVAVVLLTGAGDKVFCSGADLGEHWSLCQRPRDYYKWISDFIAMQTRLLRMGKPTIAVLNGLVLGAGNELNLACDLAVAADDVVIRQAGTARGSVAAIGVTQWLPLTVGDRRAREALFTCADIPATKALDWGLVNQVVARRDLPSVTRALVQELADKFTESMRYTKAQTNFWKELVWASTASHAADWLAIHSGSVEAFEGMGAFREKRVVDHLGLRERAADDASPEFHWGPPVASCRNCEATNLPAGLRFCGACGVEFE